MTDAVDVAERAFFREEFRRRTLVIAVPTSAVERVLPVVRELLAGGCRVLVVTDSSGVAPVTDGLAVVDSVAAGSAPPTASSAEAARLWCELEDTGVRVVGTETDPVKAAAQLAGRLGVYKLVLIDDRPDWGGSFASVDDLEPIASDRPTAVQAITRALNDGVGGVNVCRADDLDTELFTFDGAGTLFTADAYVQVTRIGADDLPAVEQLAARGVAEGFLRPRERTEIIRLALGGLAARVGPTRALVGFGALETERYAGDRVAEVTCLYTVNRYSGEGIGGRLIDGLVGKARRGDVDAVFACTVSERAAALFRRCGFSTVDLSELPEHKWVDYDPERRSRLTAHRYEFDRTEAHGR